MSSYNTIRIVEVPTFDTIPDPEIPGVSYDVQIRLDDNTVVGVELTPLVGSNTLDDFGFSDDEVTVPGIGADAVQAAWESIVPAAIIKVRANLASLAPVVEAATALTRNEATR